MSLPVRMSLRQKDRLKNILILVIGGYLFVTWSRQGAETYAEGGYDGILQEESIDFGAGFHEVPNYKLPREGPGENGQGVLLSGTEQEEGQKQIKDLFMNVVARAKVYGAKKATGDVIVFLDAHCEANEGWIEPLLSRIHEERTAVVCPTIDSISANNMAYLGGSAGGIGSFWWSLHYSMEGMPQSEIKRRKNPATDNIRTPTMAGGLFAVSREYFFEIGAYDEEMDIWGGENLEISFRVWMCGGSVEIIPCSHVGHIYRDGHPYNMTGRGGNKDVHGTNSKRLAEVWMDDYKRLYYMYRMGLKDQPVGDISSRLALRRRLKCQSFKWFLDNVIPQKFVMDEDVWAFGQVTGERGLCLDTLQRLENKGTVNLGVFNCQGGGSSSEMFSISKDKEFRREATCVDVGSQISTGVYRVVLRFCNNNKAVFEHPKNGGYLKHKDRQLCIDAEGVQSGEDVSFRKCEDGKKSQQWTISHYYDL